MTRPQNNTGVRNSFLLILLTLITSIFFNLVAVPQVAKADACSKLGIVGPDADCGDAAAKLFGGSSSDTVITFTDFKGDLAPASTEGYAKGLTQATDARTYILNITNFALGFLGLAAVLVIVYGGYLTVISAGNPEGFGKGKKAITYAAIGLIMVMSSFAIVNTIILAPTGSDKGSSAGGSATSLRGVAGQQRFNYLAQKMEELSTRLKKTVNFYNNLAITTSTLKENLLASYPFVDNEACGGKYTAANNCDDWNQGIESRLNTYRIAAANTASTLEEYRNSPNAPIELQNKLADMINQLHKADSAYNKAKEKASGNGCLGSGSCGDGDAKAIFTAFQDGLGEDGKPDKIFKKSSEIIKTMEAAINSIKTEVESIQTKLNGITAISKDGIGSTYFTSLKQSLATISSADMSIEAQRTTTINTTVTALGQFAEIIDILKNVKSVDAVLTADVTIGNAPLIVNLSSVGSSDPSGLNIDAKQIHWDLNGDGTDDTGETSGCKPTDATANCTFTKPGTYRVILNIDPSSAYNKVTELKYNQEIAPGSSYIDIKVNPASTKINLTTSNQADNVQDILKYDDKGIIKEDKAAVYYTISEAKAGILFNAEETTLSDGVSKILGKDEAKIKWNFGTKSEFNNVVLSPAQKNLQIKQSFPGEGSYPIFFEVTDKNGVTDRKVFTVIVSDVAPRITNATKNSLINQEVTFDGSNSSSENQNTIFNWTIDKLPVSSKTTSALPLWMQKIAHAADNSNISATDLSKFVIPSKKLEPQKRSETNDFYDCKMPGDKDDLLTCKFMRAGDYKITLELDSNNKSYTESTQIHISSNPPEAAFKTVELVKKAPALYRLDGSLSFDQDEKDNSNLEYSWEITPANCTVVSLVTDKINPTDDEYAQAARDNKSDQKSCDSLKDFSATNSKPVVKFNKKDSYTVSLVVRSIDEPNSISSSTEKVLTIDNILDLNWGDMKPSASLEVPGSTTTTNPDPLPGQVNTDPVAPITFKFESSQAVSYELDFGDGTNKAGDMNKTAEVIHSYNKTGKYLAKLTVFDPDDVENTISRQIFIGDGKNPVGIIRTKVNGNETEPTEIVTNDGRKFSNVIIVNRRDNLTFDADQSINTDGTGRRLQYAWNINNNEKQATGKSVMYRFGELSGKEPFPVKLKVTNEKDATQFGEDTVKIIVIGETPTLRSLTAVLETGDQITPVNVKLNAVGAEDLDGQIIQYKWWYYPDETGVNASTDNRSGVQITSSPEATLAIGTRGVEGEKITYRFGVEMTDNDNNVVATDATTDAQKLVIHTPTVQVVNGANKAPVAMFSVDRSNINVGESITFSSSSIDPDEGGSIKEYKWDFGDGSKGENKSSVTHTYTKANADGYKAKLTVVDNNSSESTSKPIKIFVDAEAQPPVAAFTVNTTPGSKSAQFTNTSTADTAAGAKLTKYSWDFDVNTDSNGDGKKDNDIDSGDLSPIYTYPEFGIYRAKLTVQDDQGQSRSVTNFVNIKVAEALKPAASTPTNNNNTSTPTNQVNKSVGANLFEASNRVDLGVVIASLVAYVILLLVSRKNNQEEKQNS